MKELKCINVQTSSGPEVNKLARISELLTVHPPIKSYMLSWAHLEARALCSSDFNSSMLAKPSPLVNLVVLRGQPVWVLQFIKKFEGY
ncbi:hypothetical protein CMV_015438 [Castanea mollissima]|uniref:Uncharacterized protein n=1 Tax=Castanea mollissima TaxID=60419 RepID=A0A8J4RA45_9ROSI|nr:hypothetical protein CMV_015438 [Castanea mollissima]